MRPILPFFLGALFGAISATSLVMILDGPQAAPEGPVEGADLAVGSTSSLSVTSDLMDLRSRLALIEEQLNRQTEMLVGLQRHRSWNQRSSPQDQGPSSVDLDALIAALDLAERKRHADHLSALSDQHLIAEGRRLRSVDPRRAETYLEAALARPLTVEQRAETLTSLGMVLRSGGDLIGAERVLEEAATSSATADTRAWASYELAMTLTESNQDERALAAVHAVLGAPEVSDWNRLHAEWATATLAERLGDTARADLLYQAILKDCGTRAGFEWLRVKVEAHLESRR